MALDSDFKTLSKYILSKFDSEMLFLNHLGWK